MKLDVLKKNYNKVLEREKTAEKYLNQATEEQLKSWIPAFLKIVMELSQMILDYKKLTGREMTQSEILEGFK